MKVQKLVIPALLLGSVLMVVLTVGPGRGLTEVLASPGTQGLAQFSPVQISFEPDSIETNTNDSFTMDIVVNAGTQEVTSVQAFLDFDPALLQVVDADPVIDGIQIQRGSTLTVRLTNSADNVLGQIDYAAGNLSQPPSGAFVLATVTFRATAQTLGTDINLTSLPPRNTFADFLGDPLPTNVSGAGVVITGIAGLAETHFNLHQDADGATGFKVNVTQVFDPGASNNVPAELGSFQAELTYDPACISILDVRGEVFEITVSHNDEVPRVTTIDGDAIGDVALPANLGFVLTRLLESALQPCSLTLQVTSLKDVTGNSIVVSDTLTENFLRGDARADRVINIADALFIAQYLVGSRPACTTVVDTTCLHSVNAASVQQNGDFDKKTIADALFIAQYLVGRRDVFYNLLP